MNNENKIPFALFNSKIKFNPYQYDPYYKFFEQEKPRKLLINDDVGLGKTIEAGIILTEYINQNSDINENPRILIIAPPNLCAQWKSELSELFMLDFYNYYLNPNYIQNIASINHLILPISRLNKIELDTKYDLIIVDEAHYFKNDKSDRTNNLKDILKNCTDKIFMTATPIVNNNEEYNELCKLIGITKNSDIKKYVTANNKADANCMNYVNSIIELDVNFSENEKKFYEITKSSDISIITHIACSSLYAYYKLLTKYKEKRILTLLKYAYNEENNLDKEMLTNKEKKQLLESLNKNCEKFEYAEKLPLDLSYDKLTEIYNDLEKEKDGIESKYKNFFEDNKFNRIIEWIENRNENTFVIFAHYIDTCIYLKNKFENYKTGDYLPFDVFMAIGSKQTRKKNNSEIQSFKGWNGSEKKKAILILSDAYKEGINLHKNCHCLINYDIPFTPSALQQRLGRIDRTGQENRPEIVNIVVKDTYDDYLMGEIILNKINIIKKESSRGLVCDIDVISLTNKKYKSELIQKYIKYIFNKSENDNDVTKIVRNKLLRVSPNYIRKEAENNIEFLLDENTKIIANTNNKKDDVTEIIHNKLLRKLKNDTNQEEETTINETINNVENNIQFLLDKNIKIFKQNNETEIIAKKEIDLLNLFEFETNDIKFLLDENTRIIAENKIDLLNLFEFDEEIIDKETIQKFHEENYRKKHKNIAKKIFETEDFYKKLDSYLKEKLENINYDLQELMKKIIAEPKLGEYIRGVFKDNKYNDYLSIDEYELEKSEDEVLILTKKFLKDKIDLNYYYIFSSNEIIKENISSSGEKINPYEKIDFEEYKNNFICLNEYIKNFDGGIGFEYYIGK